MVEKSTKAVDEGYQQFQLICLRLVEALTGLQEFQRRFHPLAASGIFEDLWIFKESITHAGQKLREIAEPEVLNGPVDILKDAINRVLDTLNIIIASKALDSEEAVFRIMRAFRNTGRLQEKLYGIRHTSPYLDRFFVEPQAQHPIEESFPASQQDDMVGLQHIGTEDDAYARGAPSLYVPESYDGKTPRPLVSS